jgi:hypothetical protein
MLHPKVLPLGRGAPAKKPKTKISHRVLIEPNDHGGNRKPSGSSMHLTQQTLILKK